MENVAVVLCVKALSTFFNSNRVADMVKPVRGLNFGFDILRFLGVVFLSVHKKIF